MLKHFRRGILAQLALLAFAGSVMTLHATPACTNTITFPSFGAVPISQITSGTCIQSGDKLFGDFNLGNLPSDTSLILSFLTSTSQANITFSGSFAAGTAFHFGYEVAVVNSPNVITGLEADLVQTLGTSTLVQTTTPAGTGSINISKTGNVLSGPSAITFSQGQDVTDLLVNATFTLGATSNASAVLNSLPEETPPEVPEPASIVLLGSGLLGLSGFARHRSSRCRS